MQAYIDTELSWNAITEPFEYPPFCNDFVCSPLQTVPKRGSSTRRVVIDLSFLSSCSVNDGIPQDTYMYLDEYYKLQRSPGLTGLSNSSLRKVVTVLFSRKTCAELIVCFPLIRKITIYCTWFSLSGQILFWNSLSFWFTFLGKILSTCTWEVWRAWKSQA